MFGTPTPARFDPLLPSGGLAAEAAGDGAGRSNMTGLLALNLLLLAFFILLTALSSREGAKTRAVLDSVQDSFGGSRIVSDGGAGAPGAAGAESAEARLQAALGQLFQNMLPLVVRRETPQGAETYLELSAGTFFGPGRTAFQPGRRVLLERLAVALSQALGGGLDFQFQLLHSAGQGAAAARLATERTAAMAAELVRQGVAPARLTVGLFLSEERAARVRLVLQVRRPASDAGPA